MPNPTQNKIVILFFLQYSKGAFNSFVLRQKRGMERKVNKRSFQGGHIDAGVMDKQYILRDKVTPHSHGSFSQKQQMSLWFVNYSEGERVCSKVQTGNILTFHVARVHLKN